MIDSEVITFIRHEIRKQMNIILSGSAGDNTAKTENIRELYPGSPTIAERPVMHPYGFVSRAVPGTIQVTGRQGEHPANRLILGHRDDARPDLNVGEAILYDAYGHVVYLSSSKMTFGSKNSSENMVLGQIFKTMMATVLDAVATHTHITSAPGSPTGVPLNAAVFSGQAASPIGDDAILSDIAFTEKGG